jgi:hypothetical protein
MKSNKLHQNQQPNVKREEKMSISRCKEIQETIQLRRKDMKLLIAFAVGEKTLTPQYRVKNAVRTQQDDKCLLWSLNQLREQIRHLEQELLRQRGSV